MRMRAWYAVTGVAVAVTVTRSVTLRRLFIRELATDCRYLASGHTGCNQVGGTQHLRVHRNGDQRGDVFKAFVVEQRYSDGAPSIVILATQFCEVDLECERQT